MGVLVGTRSHVEILDRKVLWIRGESSERLIEAVQLQNPPTRFAWVRVLPAKPTRITRAGPRLFEALEETTNVPTPLREAVKARKFGPSILSLVFRDDPRPPEDADTTAPQARSQPFAVENLKYFEGRTTTSTVTRRKRLPESFEVWLSEQNLILSPLQFNALAEQFDEGMVLAVTSYEGVPTAERLWLGPVSYEFAGTRGVYPARQLGPQLPRDREYALYTIAAAPLVPELNVEWSERPWATAESPRADWLRVQYHQPIELGTKLSLEQHLDISLTEGDHLLAGIMRSSAPLAAELKLSPREVDHVPTLPGRGRRGAALDLFLVLLLGLLPLLYTPESWLLLWVAYRFRERRRQDEDAPTWGLLLWPFYALGVALYYLVTLEDMARVAALLPMALAIIRLATPAPDPEREFFFRFRPKKAPRKSVGPPRKSMAPGRAGDVRRTGDLRPVQVPDSPGNPRPSAPAPRPSGAPPSTGGAGSKGDT